MINPILISVKVERVHEEPIQFSEGNRMQVAEIQGKLEQYEAQFQ